MKLTAEVVRSQVGVREVPREVLAHILQAVALAVFALQQFPVPQQQPVQQTGDPRRVGVRFARARGRQTLQCLSQDGHQQAGLG